jgi:ribosomal protein RSM22 (predicted rRNA methylase)
MNQNTIPLFPHLDDASRRLVDRIPTLVDEVFPLPGRFRAGLPRDVATLSGLLTFSRGERDAAYLGKAPLLSAYLRYFLPWNVYRLCRLLPALPLTLGDGDSIVDLGAGPLTLPLALWIARPELRERRLELRCLDKTGAALDAGKKLFDALSGGNSPWTIRLIRAPLGADLRGPKAALVTAINVFNELFWDIDHGQSAALAAFAERSARLLSSLIIEAGSALVVEPGIPQSGAFIAALRAALAERGRAPRAPCPHAESCPCSGGGLNHGKARWCHFTFDTSDAPKPLLQLSDAAGIPKERATMSFLMAGQPADTPPGLITRVISDAFPVGAPLYGRYACSARGLVLLTGSRAALEQRPCGALLRLDPPDERVPLPRDPKSHALVFKV